jgi:hypothetical protein
VPINYLKAMETKKAEAKPMPSGFEPFYKWHQEEGRDLLELHLQGISSLLSLRISKESETHGV